MQKVRLDREIADREVLRKKLCLYLKLEFALQALGKQASEVANKTTWNLLSRDKKVSIENIRLIEPAEIDEVRNYLDLLPIQTIKEMRTIRSSLRKCALAIDGYDEGTEWPVEITSSSWGPKGNPTGSIGKAAKDVDSACQAVVTESASAIQEITERQRPNL